MKIDFQQAETLYHKYASSHKSAFFYSQSLLDARLNLLKRYFPSGTRHCIAIKTCNQAEVLKHIAKRNFGLEAASLEEVHLAIAAGVPHEKIVFDSPVKTREEIQWIHQNTTGLMTNANCLEELERYPKDFSGILGLRINPMVGSEGPEILNVSKRNSKFGVPIDRKNDIIEAFLSHPHLCAVHMHIGSQQQSYSSNLKAIECLVDLISEINSLRNQKGIDSPITWFNIGGGIDFEAGLNESEGMADFVSKASKIIGRIPELKWVTEYGNFIHKNNAFAVSRVEYVVDRQGISNAAYIHLGADLFLRKVYSNLPISYSIWSNTKEETKELYDIYGPLCFAGDVLFTEQKLNRIKAGDLFFIFETGSNTLSMWSSHCSRSKPPFIFIEESWVK